MEDATAFLTELEKSPCPRPPYRSFDGWALQDCTALDGQSPGFLGDVVRAGPARRQVIFAALAAGLVKDQGGFRSRILEATADAGEHMFLDGEVPQLLLTASMRSIARAAYGDLPDGLVATLYKVGSQPLRRRFSYRLLGSLFADPEATKRTRALGYQLRVTDDVLDRIARLHPALIHPKFQYAEWRFAPEVAPLNEAVALLQRYCSALTDDELAADIANLSEVRDIPKAIVRWFERADRLPPPPIAGDEEVSPLTSGAELVRAGRDFQNCLGSKILAVAAGDAYYYVRRVEPVGIASIHRLTDGSWFLGGIHAPGNAPPSEELARAMQDKFASRGIPYLARIEPKPEWEACLPVLRHYPVIDDFDFADFEAGAA